MEFSPKKKFMLIIFSFIGDWFGEVLRIIPVISLFGSCFIVINFLLQ